MCVSKISDGNILVTFTILLSTKCEVSDKKSCLVLCVQILRDARAELQVRRERMSADNRDFAAEMRNKVGKVLAERRRESEAARGAGAIVSPPCKD